MEKNLNIVKNKVRPQNKHLIYYKKGQSGNLNGRPKGAKSWSTCLEEAVNDLVAEGVLDSGDAKKEILKSLLKLGIKKGDLGAIKEFSERTWGKVKDKVEVETPNVNIINIMNEKYKK